ncbi:HMMR protein, partial [Polypterus senegalus]
MFWFCFFLFKKSGISAQIDRDCHVIKRWEMSTKPRRDVSTYPHQLAAASKCNIEQAKRFGNEHVTSGDAAPGICSTDNEQMAMGKIQRASSIGTLVRVLMQQCGEQDKRIRSLEEELKKTEAKLSAALREKTGLAANIASFERQLFDLQKANELLKTKVMVFKQAEMEKQLAESENGLKQLKKKLEGLEGHLSTVVCEKEKLERDKADNEQRLSNCLTEIRQLEQSMDKYKGQINDFESMLGDKEKQAEMLKESLEKSKEELSRQSVELQEKSDQLQQEKGKLEVSQGNQEKLEAELKLLTEKLAEAEQQYQQLLDKHNELGNALTEEKDLSTSLRQLLEKMQEEFIQERSQLEGELEEVLEELNILETKEAETEEKIKAIEEENEQKSKTILELQTQLHGKVAKLDRVNDDHDKLIAQLKEEKSSSLRKIGEMETDFERNKLALINEMEVLKDSTSKLQDEIQQLKKLNKEQQEELEATRLSKDKANEEYARMLLDVQTKLAQKENELKKLEGKFVAEIEGLKQVLEDERQQFQKQLQQKDAQRKPDIDEAVLSELQNEREKWKTRYEELYSKVKPFQQQLDAFEAERKALLNENGAAQEEMNKLSDAYAKLLGHQNQKQKIKHVVKLKEENLHLKQENVYVPFRRVLVTGATGLLGRAVYKEFHDNDWHTIGCGHKRARPKFEKCNLLDPLAIRQLIQEFQPHVIIHCAAERRPDVVENQMDAATQLNVVASANLAKEAAAMPGCSYGKMQLQKDPLDGFRNLKEQGSGVTACHTLESTIPSGKQLYGHPQGSMGVVVLSGFVGGHQGKLSDIDGMTTAVVLSDLDVLSVGIGLSTGRILRSETSI